MKNVDPDTLQDIVINAQGDSIDISVEERMITSAVKVGDIDACGPNTDVTNLTEVTLRSLIRRLRKWSYVDLANDLQTAIEGAENDNIASNDGTSESGAAEPFPPRQRSESQDDAILAKLTELGYDPKNLPKNEPGKAGAKAEIKKVLGDKGIWQGKTVFAKSWDRLRGGGKIVDAA